MAAAKDKVTGLTPQQEAFVQALVSDPTISHAEAYRRAYPKSRKWKDQAVWTNAMTLSTNAYVMDRVRSLREAASTVAVIDESLVLRECARLALLDPRKLFDKDGRPKGVHELDADTAAAVSSFEVMTIPGTDGKPDINITKIKLWDKNPALEKLMKHLGMFEKDNKQKGGVFENVPRDVLKMIQEKLREQVESGLAGQSNSGSSRSFTH